MNKKTIWISITVFGVIGSYLPALFGAGGELSGWSILGGFVGSLFGIWAGVQLNNYF